MEPTILYIEDNPDNMMLVERAIESLGYRFLWAATGAQGMELALSQRPNLILLDINLPDTDGYTLAMRLRASGQAHLLTVPIIAVTANALKGDADKALAAGCNGYLPKPISTRELRRLVADAMPVSQA
jgi:two-component system cell cycle response regulator DivK